jgi:hypothetical protein
VKQFFTAVLVAAVVVMVSAQASVAGGHHSRGGVSVNVGFSVGGGYNNGYNRGCQQPIIYQQPCQPVYYPQPVYQPVGHWENVFTGYRLVQTPVTRQVVTQSIGPDGRYMSFVSEYTEWISVQVPQYQRMWVTR